VEPRKFKQFIEQAANLPRRQRADLADLLNSSLLEEKTAALIEAAGASHRACPRAARCACTAMVMRTGCSATAASTAPAPSMH
jgi:hypothetical protein